MTEIRHCRYCRQMIKWAIAAKSGKPIPLDLKSVKVWVYLQEGADMGLINGYISHYATCRTHRCHKEARKAKR